MSLKPFKDYEVSDWYECEKKHIEKLKTVKEAELILVHGDWCPDCVFTMPLVKKILADIDNKDIKITDVTVDRSKDDAAGICKKFEVKNIPTILFLIKGEVKARIIEAPKDTIEGDLAAAF